jgi:hypothetical protein
MHRSQFPLLEQKSIIFTGLTRCYPPGGKGRSKLKTKQNTTNTSQKKLKPLTENSNQQPVQRKKKRRKEEKKKKQQKQQQKQQRNPKGMLAPNINS